MDPGTVQQGPGPTLQPEQAFGQVNVAVLVRELHSIQQQYSRRLTGTVVQLLALAVGSLVLLNLHYRLFPDGTLLVAILVTMICCFATTGIAKSIQFDLTEPFGYPLLQSVLSACGLVVTLEVVLLSLLPTRELKVFAFAAVILIFLFVIFALSIQYVYGGGRHVMPPDYRLQAATLLAVIVLTILLYVLMMLDIAIRIVTITPHLVNSIQ